MDFKNAVERWLEYAKRFSENTEKVNKIIEEINQDFDGNKHRIKDKSGVYPLHMIPWRGNPAGVSPSQHGEVVFPELANYPAYVKKFKTETSGRERDPFLMMVTESCMYDKLIRSELNNGVYSNPYLLGNYGVIAPSPIPESYSDVKAIKKTADNWYIVNEPIFNLIDNSADLKKGIENQLKTGMESLSASFSNFMKALNFIPEQARTDILVELYLQIAWCLYFFDQNGIIHGDLHSGNMMILSNQTKESFLLYVDPEETFILITPRFYPVFYDYDRGFWNPLRKDTLNSQGECGFSRKELPDRWWRIEASFINSHRFLSGYDMARLFATAVPNPPTSELAKTLAKAIYKSYDPTVSLSSYLKDFQQPTKIHSMADCFNEIFTNIRKSYSNSDSRFSIEYFKGDTIAKIKTTRLSSLRVGILFPHPLALERMFEIIDPSLVSLFNSSPATPQPQAPGAYPHTYCKDLIDAFRTGAEKIRNPLSGRMVNRVDAKGKPNKIIEPLLRACGFDLPAPALKNQQRKPKAKLVKAKKTKKITFTRTACRNFRREWDKKAKTAINPLTGRKINLFTKTGRSTATAKKILEECQNNFS